jgi:RND family efflux transporter MFP subunit
MSSPGKPNRFAFTASLLLSCLVAGCGKAPPPADEPPPLAPVQAENPRLLTLAEWTDLLGTTQPLPNHVARVTAVIEGQVLPFSETDNRPSIGEGQEVKAGDVIARLDSRLVEERKKQAETAVRLAELEVNRLDLLASSKSVAGSVPLVAPVEREKARLALEDALSKRKAVEEELKFYTLRAPINGRLGIIQVVAGQTVPPGTIVAEVVDLDEIDVLCFVPPHTAARLALNQPARIVRQKSDGKDEASPATGKVVFIAVQAQPETGNFAVKVRFPNKALELRANTVVRVQVQTKAEEPRLTIPDSALMEDTDPPTVVVVQNLKAVRKVSPEDQARIQVLTTKASKGSLSPAEQKELEELSTKGKDEEQGTARKLRVKLGVRDRNERRVEILGLETDKKEPVPFEDALFVVKGGNGLQDGDAVKLEQEEEE